MTYIWRWSMASLVTIGYYWLVSLDSLAKHTQNKCAYLFTVNKYKKIGIIMEIIFATHVIKNLENFFVISSQGK